MPERFLVDVTSLTSFGSTLQVKDLDVPADVTILSDPEELLVVATAPAVEEIEEPLVDEDELEEGVEGDEEAAEGETAESTEDASAEESE